LAFGKGYNLIGETMYQIIAKDLNGHPVEMATYQNNVMLIVNTASKCGFTPQFEGLEELYQEFKDQGFVILGFPSNQFLNQEPLDAQGIKEFCTLTYPVSFPMFDKVDVNGKKRHPMYEWLSKQQPDPKLKKIKWNFTKFLIDREGNIVGRYEPNVKPEAIRDDIQRLL
jgi:glutathione peroxidase